MCEIAPDVRYSTCNALPTKVRTCSLQVHFVPLGVELFDIKVFKKKHISASLASRLVAHVEVQNAQSQVMGIKKNFIFSHCTETQQRYICTCILNAKCKYTKASENDWCLNLSLVIKTKSFSVTLVKVWECGY